MYTPYNNPVSSALHEARLARAKYLNGIITGFVEKCIARIASRKAALAQIARHAAANAPKVHQHGGFTAIERHLLTRFTIPWMLPR